MADQNNLKDKVMKAVSDEGAELRYSFLVYLEDDKLKFFAHVNKGEINAILGMLERAQNQLLRRIEELEE